MLKDLVIGQEYNAILVIVNKFIKQGYFIGCIEEMSIKDLVKVYIKYIFIQHSILKKIILN